METRRTKSKLRKAGIICCLLVTLSILLTLLIVAIMPIQSNSVKGTFRYSIYASPVWYDETSTHNPSLKLWYGSRFQIVEKELADANSKFLKVISGGFDDNIIDITANSREDSARRHKVVFDVRFNGPEVPYPAVYKACIIDVNDLISELNVTNGEITISLHAFLNDINAYIPELEWRGAYISNESNSSISVTTITIQNGEPTQVKSGNVTTTTTANLGFSEWSVEDTLKLYNPDVIKIKEMIPILATIGIISNSISAVLIYAPAKNR